MWQWVMMQQDTPGTHKRKLMRTLLKEDMKTTEVNPMIHTLFHRSTTILYA